MPLTAKGRKIKRAMEKTYGKRAERVFYASRNAGKITGVDSPGIHRMAAARRSTGY